MRRVAAGIALLLLGCATGGGTERVTPTSLGPVPAGATARIDGSPLLAPLTTAVVDQYRAAVPGHGITVEEGGTPLAIARLCAGEIDVAAVSRPARPDEAAVCDGRAASLIQLTAAVDAIVLVVNGGLDWTECFTLEELRSVWDDGSGVSSWRQIDGDYPDEPLVLAGPPRASELHALFSEAVNGIEGRSRTDWTEAGDLVSLQASLASGVGAMAFTSFSSMAQGFDGRVLFVDPGSGQCVRPSAATLADGRYPLIRSMSLYVTTETLGRPGVEQFLRFFLTNVSSAASGAGFVPPSPAAIDASLTQLDATG